MAPLPRTRPPSSKGERVGGLWGGRGAHTPTEIHSHPSGSPDHRRECASLRGEGGGRESVYLKSECILYTYICIYINKAVG